MYKSGGGQLLTNRRAFTLIELLAVIVILAIIALIAVPIILNIIEDARNESNERSVELYGTAVKNAATRYQLKNTNTDLTGTYKSTDATGKTIRNTVNGIELTVDYEGTEVACDKIDIFANGEVSLDECKVNKKDVDNTYGDVEEDDKTDGENGGSGSSQVYKPQYYSWSSGYVGEDLPSDATLNASELDKSSEVSDFPFYLGLDVDSNNKVSAAYVCFVKEGIEYCIKGADPDAYETNKTILEEVYSNCSDEGNGIACSGPGYIESYMGGYVYADYDMPNCGINLINGESKFRFYCSD